MRMVKDNNGQMSVDFLVGITIFLIAFLYLITAIPSLFTPFQSNSDELTMTADKVAALLVENELANNTDGGTPLPGIIDYAKFDNLNTRIKTDSIGTRTSLGLDTGNEVYNLQVVLQEYDDASDSFMNFTVSDGSQCGNENVGQSRRYVMARYSNRSAPDSFPGVKAVMVVRVW